MASLRARSKLKHLTHQDLRGLQHGEFFPELQPEITDLGLSYNLVAPFTSYVAAEEICVTVDGEPATIRVPVEMSDGVSYEGVFLDQILMRGAIALGVIRTRRALRCLVAAIELLKDPAQSAVPERVARLDSVFRGLAKNVEKLGENGNFITDGIVVSNWKIDIIIRVRDMSSVTRCVTWALLSRVKARRCHYSLEQSTSGRLRHFAKLTPVISVRPVKAVR